MNNKNRNILILIGLAVLIIFLYPKMNLNSPQGEIYSIAGTKWGCDTLPYKGGVFSSGTSTNAYLSMPPNSATILSCPSACGGSCLFDTFIGDWVPKLESKNSVDFDCPASSPNFDPLTPGGMECKIQVYCCDHQDCSSDSQCVSWFGSGYTCAPSTSDRDPYIDFGWSSWRYCQKQGDTDHRCWRIAGNACEEHNPPYLQSVLDRDWSGHCPSVWPYESLASCNSSLKTCAQRNGNICTSAQTCNGNIMTATDSDKCCDVACSSGGDGGDGGDGGSGGDGNTVFGNGLTISEFMSAGYMQVAKSTCLDNCNLKEGFTVTCDKKFGQFIFKDMEKEFCSDFFGSLRAVPIAGPLVTGFICNVLEGSLTLANKLSPLGVCVAEPTGYSKYWQNTLKAVYEMGIPRMWVLPIVIVFLLLMAFVIVSFLK